MLDIFSVERARSAAYNWIHKADLELTSEKNPDHVAVDETVIQPNDQQCWLYAAVGSETNELLHTSLEPTINTGLTEAFFAEIRKKHDVGDAVFFVDRSHSLQAACHRAGHDFRYKKYGNRNVVKCVFREIKRRTICSSNCFSHASEETADNWIRSFSFTFSLFEHYWVSRRLTQATLF